MNWRIVAMAVGCALATPPADAQTYGAALVQRVSAKHPGVSGAVIDATTKDGAAIHLAWGMTGAGGTTVPLADALGNPIGTVTVSSSRPNVALPFVQALSRRIYVVGNLIEPDPFVAGAHPSQRGQVLVDRMVDRFPDLVTLAMHVALPGQPNRIIASSFGRIGKLGDHDDLDVIANRATRTEITDRGHRLAIELPLLDRRHRVIGALSTSFTMADGSEARRVAARAVVLRDTLARLIPSLAALGNP